MSRNSILDGIRVIDGGLATELEYHGARINGPLWSAHVLEDEPEKLTAVHHAYIAAGAECIATCSYQVSRMGYAEVGLSAERARRQANFLTGALWSRGHLALMAPRFTTAVSITGSTIAPMTIS